MIMSEPLELQAQRPYALDQLTMLQSQIMQTIQGMVVLRARIEKQRRSNIEAARDTYTELDRARGRLIEQLSKSELFLLEMEEYPLAAAADQLRRGLAGFNLGLFYCAAWGLYFYLSNLAGTWSHAVAFVGTPFESVIFFFDPTELPIITIYALYIPIFINWMKKATDESALRRYVIPTLAICGSIFMVIACLIGHKMGNFWYLLTFAVIMLIGKRFAKNNV